jgi:3-dehydroquinate dehydratase-2
MKKIAVLNGPNLDRLGKREPEIYGSATLGDLEKALLSEFGAKASLEFFQSNRVPAVEVHISNIYKREEFRHTSLTAPACTAVITGLGLEGYHAAIRFLLQA